jgi:hypothetical protein
MDISGGMPAVIIKMLVASAPGKIRLLPARPEAWPSGTIEGVLCRGQIEIEQLQWSGEHVLVRLVSVKKQSIELEVPDTFGDFMVKEGKASVEETGRSNVRNLYLPAREAITLEIN